MPEKSTPSPGCVRVLLLLVLGLLALSEHRGMSWFSQAANETRANVTNSQTGPAQTSPERVKQPARRDRQAAKSLGDRDSNDHVQSNLKRQQALDLIERVLLRSVRVSPIDYRILAEVEAATILWQFDRDRSFSILKDSLSLMREAFAKKSGSTVPDRQLEARNRKLRFMILQKIARLKPELVQELLSDGDKPSETVQAEWTDESRALISLAAEQIQQDPKAAARLFMQSLALGPADWTSFLEKLSRRDNNEAERAGTVLIDRLRDSSITPIALRNLARFALAPERSSSLKEHFFRSVAIRLRRDIRPDIPSSDLEDDLSLAREMSRWAGIHLPQLQKEFDDMRIAFEGAFASRPLATSSSPVSKTLDIQTTLSAKPGETTEISEALPKVGQLADPRTRNKQYQKLAIDAARNADARLAEEILSKIDNESVRLETTALVYSPLVKKAIGESDWLSAQKLASNIPEPLARTLAFDGIANSMSKMRQDNQEVLEVYREALRLLDRDSPTERVAKAYLMLAKPFYSRDRDRGLEVVKSFAFVLNKLAIKDEPFEESTIEPSVAAWVRYTDYSLTPDEILNLPDLVAGAFEDLARRNSDDALSVAETIRNEGVYSFAQLAVARVLLLEAKASSSSADKRQKNRR